MMNRRRDCYQTVVSPVVMRLLPELNKLNKLKRLNAKVQFDYFSINVITINQCFLDRECCVENEIRSNYFKSGHRYSYIDKLTGEFINFSVMAECVFLSNFKYQVQLNPNSFSDGKSYFLFLIKITGKLTEENHLIGRIDIAYLLSGEVFSPTLVDLTAHYKWKIKSAEFLSKVNEHYRGRITGKRTSSRTLNISCYDRRAKNASLPKGKRVHIKDEEEIKYEFQLNRKCLATFDIYTVFDLYKLNERRFTKRIAFYDPSKVSKGNKELIQKMEDFQYQIIEVGFHHARMRVNKNRNFSRDFGRYLFPVTLNHGKATLAYCLSKRFKEWYAKWAPSRKWFRKGNE